MHFEAIHFGAISGRQIWETIHIESTPRIGHNRSTMRRILLLALEQMFIKQILAKIGTSYRCDAQCGAILPIIQLSFLIRTIYLGRKRTRNFADTEPSQKEPKKDISRSVWEGRLRHGPFHDYSLHLPSSNAFFISFNFICFRQLPSPLLSNIPAGHLITTITDPRLRRGSFPEAD